MAKKIPLVDRTPGRVCWSCEHVYFSPGMYGYSEYTSGSDFHLSCGKGHWEFENYEDSLDQFREKLMTAEICGDFVGRSRPSASSTTEAS